MFLLIIWEFHAMNHDHTHFPILPDLLPPLPVTTPKKEEKGEKSKSPICVAHVLSGAQSNGWPVSPTCTITRSHQQWRATIFTSSL